MSQTPMIPADKRVAELSIRSILLALLLTVLLAMSNAYLALKLGILTSASIPAAIISMGVLRLFKNPSILENNAVQTAASAGEAVAGGIVYSLPALVIIGYWQQFDYLTNFIIAATGGILGVLFSIPLRRVLVNEPVLRFPEGRAIAEVLKSSSEKVGLSSLVIGGVIGATLELCQTGFKVLANSWQYWLLAGRSIFGLGTGFSATMLGAGYLIGFDMAVSIFLGAVMAWLIALPIASHQFPHYLAAYPVQDAAQLLWNDKMRYLGIGAMLFAGIWTLLQLIKPLGESMRASLSDFAGARKTRTTLPRTDRDIPLPLILIGVCVIAAGLFVFFRTLFPLDKIGFEPSFAPSATFVLVLYVIVAGFIFSVITAYFSGMVGVTASPGSSVMIAGVLFAAWLVFGLIKLVIPLPLNATQLQAAEAITIIIGSVVLAIAAIANDNTQDLKVGQLVGATPWKQQLMLLFGVLISALIIPPVMQLLFDVYGLAGVMPKPGMDISQSLPAPTAALLAAVTEGVFHNTLPWSMMLMGALIMMGCILTTRLTPLTRRLNLSILGVAIGMYLPLATSFPLFLGGLIAFFVQRKLQQHQGLTPEEKIRRTQTGTLIGCGLVAGAALMDVFLAVPFSLWHSPDALSLVTPAWQPYGVLLSCLAVVLLARWIERKVCT